MLQINQWQEERKYIRIGLYDLLRPDRHHAPSRAEGQQGKDGNQAEDAPKLVLVHYLISLLLNRPYAIFPLAR